MSNTYELLNAIGLWHLYMKINKLKNNTARWLTDSSGIAFVETDKEPLEKCLFNLSTSTPHTSDTFTRNQKKKIFLVVPNKHGSFLRKCPHNSIQHVNQLIGKFLAKYDRRMHKIYTSIYGYQEDMPCTKMQIQHY